MFEGGEIIRRTCQTLSLVTATMAACFMAMDDKHRELWKAEEELQEVLLQHRKQLELLSGRRRLLRRRRSPSATLVLPTGSAVEHIHPLNLYTLVKPMPPPAW